jgi:SAM-dependent methyltransferase
MNDRRGDGAVVGVDGRLSDADRDGPYTPCRFPARVRRTDWSSGVSEYLMAGQPSEAERLRLQSQVWEPAGVRLLGVLGEGTGRRALDVGCGGMGWLRALARWASGGQVMGTDIDDRMLGFAAQFREEQSLPNVELRRDDLFDSRLEPASFDLVHARFQLAPLGRGDEQVRAFLRLVRPGGWIVLEDPDIGSWHYNPHAPALAELVELIVEAFRRGGGDFNAGRHEAGWLRGHGLTPQVRAEVLALPPGHPYLRLPLQFSASLRPRLLSFVDVDELDALLARAARELEEPDRWGTTFTLVQTWATVDGR